MTDSGFAASLPVAHRCKACGLDIVCGPRPPVSCPKCRELASFARLPPGSPSTTRPTWGPTSEAISMSSRLRQIESSHREREAFEDEDSIANEKKARIVDPEMVERTPYLRSSVGVPGFDHVLSGGLAEGYVVMVAGAPGTHKSTIVTQALSAIQEIGMHFGEDVAYGSAEEDEDAVIETAARVAEANFKIVLSTSIQQLITALDETGAVVWAIDSLMTVTSDLLTNEPGGTTQVNACSTLLFQRSHAMGPYKGMQKRSILLVAHGTKDGDLAGPMKALHSVDGCVQMEHVDPRGDSSTGRPPWSTAPDQTRPTGFLSARVYRKMRKADGRRISYFQVQPYELEDGSLNPVGGRLDHVDGPVIGPSIR